MEEIIVNSENYGFHFVVKH